MTVYAEIPSDYCLPGLTDEINHIGLLVNPSSREDVAWSVGLHSDHDILYFRRGIAVLLIIIASICSIVIYVLGL